MTLCLGAQATTPSTTKRAVSTPCLGVMATTVWIPTAALARIPWSVATVTTPSSVATAMTLSTEVRVPIDYSVAGAMTSMWSPVAKRTFRIAAATIQQRLPSISSRSRASSRIPLMARVSKRCPTGLLRYCRMRPMATTSKIQSTPIRRRAIKRFFSISRPAYQAMTPALTMALATAGLPTRKKHLPVAPSITLRRSSG